MRLVGYAFTDPDGPVRWGYLALDELSVVLGPNDGGKSRLVRGLADWLTGRQRELSVEVGHRGAGFYAELDIQEMLALFPRLLGARFWADRNIEFMEPARVVVRRYGVPLI